MPIASPVEILPPELVLAVVLGTVTGPVCAVLVVAGWVLAEVDEGSGLSDPLLPVVAAIAAAGESVSARRTASVAMGLIGTGAI